MPSLTVPTEPHSGERPCAPAGFPEPAIWAMLRSIVPRPMVNRSFWLAAGGLSVLLLLAVGWVDYLPTNDGPQHIFAAHALHRLDDPALGYGRYLEPGGAITDIGFEAVFGTLERFLPWRPAVRITLCLFALGWAWSVLALAAALDRGRRWLGLLGFATALQWLLYMGLFSYYLSVAIGLGVLAFTFSRQESRKRDHLIVAGLLVAQAGAHVVPTVAVGLTLIILALFSAPAGGRARALARTAAVGAPAALMTLVVALQTLGNAPSTRYSVMPALAARASLIGRAFVSGPSWRAWPVVMLAAVGLASGWRLRRRGADPRERALWIMGVLLLLLALSTPLHVRGWEYFNVRFVPLAVMLLALLVPFERIRQPAWQGIALAALAAYAAGSLGWGWRHNVRLRAAHADLLAGLDAPVRRRGPRLPLILEPPPGEVADEWARDIPFVSSNWQLGALYSVEQGGVPAFLFAGEGGFVDLAWRVPPAGSPMPARPVRGYEWQLWEPAARARPIERVRALSYLLSFGPAYEDVILHGLPGDIAVLRERGYVIDFERNGLAIARFAGCPVRIELHPPPGGFPPTLVTAGWAPATNTVYSVVLAPREDSNVQSVPLPESPCGDVWIRVLFDMDRNHTASPGDRFCQDADRNGVLQARITAPGARIVCAAGAPLP